MDLQLAFRPSVQDVGFGGLGFGNYRLGLRLEV